VSEDPTAQWRCWEGRGNFAITWRFQLNWIFERVVCDEVGIGHRYTYWGILYVTVSQFLGLVRQGEAHLYGLTDLRKLSLQEFWRFRYDGCDSDRLGNKPFHLSPILLIISKIDAIYLVSLFITGVLSSKFVHLIHSWSLYHTPTPPQKKKFYLLKGEEYQSRGGSVIFMIFSIFLSQFWTQLTYSGVGKKKTVRLLLREHQLGLVHTSEGIGSGVGIGSTRSVTIQCKSKIGILRGFGSFCFRCFRRAGSH